MSPWRKIELTLPASLEDPAGALLVDLGCVGWESREAGPGRVRLLAYWRAPAPPGLRDAVARALEAVAATEAAAPGSRGGAPALSEAEEVADEDWEAGWRRHFRLERPLPGLVVRPSWITHDAAPGETVLVIDPKMAFGVGSHPTTRLCLRLLREAGAAGDVLDVGTGTGILAIAAARWGARRVVALEMDASSARNAAENVSLNGVSGRVEVVAGRLGGDVPSGGAPAGDAFDLVLANLLREELREALPAMIARLRPAGALILAGFLAGETEAIARDLAARRLGVERRAREEEWGALRARRAY